MPVGVVSVHFFILSAMRFPISSGALIYSFPLIKTVPYNFILNLFFVVIGVGLYSVKYDSSVTKFPNTEVFQ